MGHHIAHNDREVRRDMVAVPVLAEPEIIATVRDAGSVGIGNDTRRIGGPNGIFGHLRRRSGDGRLVSADRGLRDRGEHQGERQHDGHETADPSPECLKSRHSRVYSSVAVEG